MKRVRCDYGAQYKERSIESLSAPLGKWIANLFSVLYDLKDG